MKCAFALLLTCCALSAQVTPTQEPSGFQPIENPNDERLKVFAELNAKANAGDTEALRLLGEYYHRGLFPATKDSEKAKEVWTRGAALGSNECAGMMYAYAYPTSSTDSEIVIEKTKWFIIQAVLFRITHFRGEVKYPTQHQGISTASFEEAKARAAIFLGGVKMPSPSPDDSLSEKKLFGKKIGNSDDNNPVTPALRFESLSLFDTHRKNVCAAYLRASVPIYNKGEIASEAEKAAFIAAAHELVRLQAYVGKVRRLNLSSKSNAALREVNMEKMSNLYAKMAAAKIPTTLPAGRPQLNEASIYIHALGELMQLPVALNGTTSR